MTVCPFCGDAPVRPTDLRPVLDFVDARCACGLFHVRNTAERFIMWLGRSNIIQLHILRDGEWETNRMRGHSKARVGTVLDEMICAEVLRS